MKEKLTPIVIPTLKENFVHQFEQLILSGEISQGEKLPPERELAAKMKVSRPVVHEGLLELSGKGLVTIRPRHGCLVNDYRKNGSIEMINSLFHYSQGELRPEILDSIEEMRLIIETASVRHIIENNNHKKTCQELRLCLEESLALREKNPENLTLSDFSFHHTLVLNSGNMIYPLLMNSFRDVYLNLLGKFFSNPRVFELVHNYKESFILALDAKDQEKALFFIDKLSSNKTYGENFNEGQTKTSQKAP